MRVQKLAVVYLLACAAVYSQGRGFGVGREMGMHAGKVIANAPYSADVSNSVVQTLPDGNVIQHTATGKVARDAVGRTYSLETFSGGPFGQKGPQTMIFISDPVAGYSYVLNPATKEATRRVLKQWGQHAQGAANFESKSRTFPDVVSADLGTQTVSGVTAQGKTTTRTIAAGAVGNAQPITSTTETWTSPDLQVVVSSKRNDPRFGTSSYALTNIQRTAPDPSLFQVPAGYTIKDALANRFGGPRPPQ